MASAGSGQPVQLHPPLDDEGDAQVRVDAMELDTTDLKSCICSFERARNIYREVLNMRVLNEHARCTQTVCNLTTASSLDACVCAARNMRDLSTEAVDQLAADTRHLLWRLEQVSQSHADNTSPTRMLNTWDTLAQDAAGQTDKIEFCKRRLKDLIVLEAHVQYARDTLLREERRAMQAAADRARTLDDHHPSSRVSRNTRTPSPIDGSTVSASSPQPLPARGSRAHPYRDADSVTNRVLRVARSQHFAQEDMPPPPGLGMQIAPIGSATISVGQLVDPDIALSSAPSDEHRRFRFRVWRGAYHVSTIRSSSSLTSEVMRNLSPSHVFDRSAQPAGESST